MRAQRGSLGVGDQLNAPTPELVVLLEGDQDPGDRAVCDYGLREMRELRRLINGFNQRGQQLE